MSESPQALHAAVTRQYAARAYPDLWFKGQPKPKPWSPEVAEFALAVAWTADRRAELKLDMASDPPDVAERKAKVAENRRISYTATRRVHEGRIIKAIRRGKDTQAAIAEEIGLSEGHVGTIVFAMVTAGILVETGRKHLKKTYAVTETKKE